jgi:predicted Zn finger-like uncharacterized protein
MKITCQACQAKYTIADEKVVGKVVKIRCKKCGASIVVNGSEASAGARVSGPPDPPATSAASGVFTVNVADGDQRTLSEAEIVTAYRAGVIGDDTFCWKEGMTDWLPLLEISALHAACTGPQGGAAPDAVETELPATMIDPSIPAVGAGAAPRVPPRVSSRPATKDGNGSLAGPPPAATVAARRTGGRGTAADLFSGAARAGGEDDVMTSAPAETPQPHNDGPKPTGARNENSVLFALEEKGGAPPPTMPATNEASGLIDIRQLSAQMRSSSDDKKKSRVDDIMNLGGGGAFSPTLGAPVLSAPSLEHYSQPPPSMLGSMGGAGAADAKSKALIFLSLGAGTFFLVAAIGVAVLLVRGKGSITADDQEKPTTSASVAGKTPAPGSSVATTAPAAATTETAQASAAPESPTAPSESAGAAKEPSTKETKETAAKETAPAPAPVVPKEPKAPAAAAAPKEAAPATGTPVAEFNMGEARSRLASVAGGVQTCKRGDTTGAGRVEIIFAPSGAVQSANLMPGSPFDGTPTGKCVEARFRGARVPPFGGSPFTVTKSFSIN